MLFFYKLSHDVQAYQTTNEIQKIFYFVVDFMQLLFPLIGARNSAAFDRRREWNVCVFLSPEAALER